MKIEILGGGCSRCDQLYAKTQEALKSAGLEAELIKDTNYESIIHYGITATPALVVDGVVKSSGRVLNTDEILTLLR